MISLGIDLSLRETGCVKTDGEEIIDTQLIKSKPDGKLPINELSRICNIRDSIDTTEVGIAVIEGLAFMARNSTALTQLSGLNYMCRELLMLSDIPFIIVAPTTLKKFITGKGNCGKDVMMLETYKRYGATFDNNNLCDAFGLSIIGSVLSQKNPKLIKPQQEVINLLKEQL